MASEDFAALRAQLSLTIPQGPGRQYRASRDNDEHTHQLTHLGVEAAGWTCNAVARTVTCTSPAAIPVGGTSSFVLDTMVAPGTTGTVTNTAEVQTPDGTDSDSASGIVVQPGQPVHDGSLPDTGAPLLTLAILGLLAIAAGGALVAARPRRRHDA